MAMPHLGDVESIFHQALEIKSGPDRSAWLTVQCADHAELLVEVSSLLSAHDQMASPRGSPPAIPAPAIPSEEFGSYRLVRLLGQGGMSSVYLAERVDGRFHKQVAVKVM